MRPLKTGLRGLGAVAITTMLALAAPAAAAEDNDGGKTKTVVGSGAEAWGFNTIGQLGIGTSGQFADRDTAATMHVPAHVLAVAAGGSHSLVLLTNGTVKACGSNSNGQLGYGIVGREQSEPGNVAGLGGVKAIAAGAAHSIALLKNGTVMTWGANDRGQLGDGTTTRRSRPVAVTGLGGVKVTAIAAGNQFSMALLSNGKLKTWGDNNFGQLGIGTADTNTHPNPVDVSGLAGVKVKAIDAGEAHSLAATASGGAKGWGLNDQGQVGNGNQVTPQPTPVDVVGLAGVRVKAVSGGSGHSLALLTNGRIKGWGANADGQLGDGTSVSPRLRPVDTVGLTHVKAISAGIGPMTALGFSLAISGKTVYSWSRTDRFGELGTGGATSLVPVAVRTGLSNPKSISTGLLFSLAS